MPSDKTAEEFLAEWDRQAQTRRPLRIPGHARERLGHPPANVKAAGCGGRGPAECAGCEDADDGFGNWPGRCPHYASPCQRNRALTAWRAGGPGCERWKRGE